MVRQGLLEVGFQRDPQDEEQVRSRAWGPGREKRVQRPAVMRVVSLRIDSGLLGAGQGSHGLCDDDVLSQMMSYTWQQIRMIDSCRPNRPGWDHQLNQGLIWAEESWKVEEEGRGAKEKKEVGGLLVPQVPQWCSSLGAGSQHCSHLVFSALWVLRMRSLVVERSADSLGS